MQFPQVYSDTEGWKIGHRGRIGHYFQEGWSLCEQRRDFKTQPIAFADFDHHKFCPRCEQAKRAQDTRRAQEIRVRGYRQLPLPG